MKGWTLLQIRERCKYHVQYYTNEFENLDEVDTLQEYIDYQNEPKGKFKNKINQ